METINVYLGLINTGMSIKKSKILNFSLVNNLNNKSLYVENASIKEEDLDDYMKEIYKNQVLNDCDDFYNELSDDEITESKTRFCKKKEEEIPLIVLQYLRDISDNGTKKIKFITSNPSDWIFFLNIAFNFTSEELPMIPENVSYFPRDVVGLLSLGDDIEDTYINNLINDTLGIDDKEFDSNSLFQANTLQIKFDKILNNN